MGTNTGLGIGIGIPFKNNALGGDKPYFPPELKARMIGVWTSYGKKNTDADRNIIKNKIPNAGGDLEILNAAYKLNSGFGKYSEDFTTWTKSSKITSIDSESFDFVSDANFNLLYYKSNIGKDIPSFKVHIKLKVEGKVFYNYITSEGVFTNKVITSEEYVVPISYNTKYTGETPVNCGFSIGVISEECSGTITQIPNFEDAFVTDGINDMIISQKTLQEMGVTKELTIVSMIHQISWRGSASIPLTNYIRNGDTFIRNSISNIGKTGIYGYTCFNVKNVNSSASKVINNILGDKNDYIVEYRGDILSERFSVQGYIDANGNILETSSVAHYWTFAVLGKATEDEINLIIGNYNLDRSLKPDILCNIGKQGITNDNHADFNDKLIDYSGNGRDIQMYNLAWKGSSGVAAKKFETIKDYLIVLDEGLQELTIYNEFSYKVKSIKHAARYWTVQSLNKTDVSYPITIIADKDIIWRNALNYTDENGVKGNIRKETNVPANTPTQVFVLGFNDFDVPDNYTKVNCVAYATRTDITEFTITFIPSCKGGILLDGINDFGKVIDMPIYKDYTFIIDREIISIGNTAGIVASKSEDSTDVNKQGAFLFEYLGSPNNVSAWSFYKDNGKVANTDFTKSISYQSKYSYNGIELLAGTAFDSDKLWLGTLRDKDSRFANVVIYSLMSFPYSMSKFLIERQLKKHKLGTFYPNMVEFRPVIKANANYKITCYQIDSTNTWKLIKVGDYIVIGAKLAFQITFDNDASELKEVVSPQLSDIIVEKRPSNPGYNIYSYITSKSPQKINITIDEYIRYEDIVQPYPVVFQITDRNTNQRYSWGDKIKVGSSIQLTQGENPNLLSGLYSVQSYEYEGETYTYNQLKALVIIITKSGIQLSCNKVWTFDDNEPKCILSPRLLRIPNSSYKILGYIPDISGHGNHGVIHNSAYAEGSGVNEDGSYQFDGVDDFVTIPTLFSGGKQVLMKVNWNSLNHVLYDQRNNAEAPFCIVAASGTIAYNQSNIGGNTYIDGILNNHILADDLQAITHNIVLNNDYNVANSNSFIGTNYTKSIYAKMSLYDFMLFDNISTEDKIKELNEYVGIEAKVELPPYYWDAYGKTNLDGDKATIQQRGVAVGDYDLTNNNLAYEGMSGFGGYTLGKFTNSWSLSNNSNSISIVARNPYDITLKKLGGNSDWEFNTTELKIISNPVSVKFKSDKNIRFKCDYHYYTVGGNSEGAHLGITSKDLIANEDTIITISPISQENIDKYNIDINRGYYLIYFQLSPTLEVNEEVTIEMLPLYPNGLVYDGITDYSKNANIPVLTDYTYIYKRTIINIPTNAATLLKGADKTNGGAFIADYGNKWQFNFGQYNIIQGIADGINWQTVNSFNGTSINKGENTDDSGITVAKFSNGYTSMVFYKLILYPKTISLLEINFLKNLMEKDEIIDLNNPIFIKNE